MSNRGSVRYQHDSGADVVEMAVATSEVSGYMGLPDRAFIHEIGKDAGKTSYQRECTSLRAIHNQLIERVNTSMGGWCETLGSSGDVEYRHAADGSSR